MSELPFYFLESLIFISKKALRFRENVTTPYISLVLLLKIMLTVSKWQNTVSRKTSQCIFKITNKLISSISFMKSITPQCFKCTNL